MTRALPLTHLGRRPKNLPKKLFKKNAKKLKDGLFRFKGNKPSFQLLCSLFQKVLGFQRGFLKSPFGGVKGQSPLRVFRHTKPVLTKQYFSVK